MRVLAYETSSPEDDGGGLHVGVDVDGRHDKFGVGVMCIESKSVQ